MELWCTTSRLPSTTSSTSEVPRRASKSLGDKPGHTLPSRVVRGLTCPHKDIAIPALYR